MSDETPQQNESLVERAMRRAREAQVTSSSGGLEQAGVIGAASAGGLAAAAKDATSPATYVFRSARPPEATVRVFTDALQALGDRDTRPQVAFRGDQATIQFQQLLPTGNWVHAVTVTLVQSSDEVNVTASAPGLATLGGAAAEIGGATLGTLGKVLTGNILGGLTEAARSVGRITESAENLTLSNTIRAAIVRLGNQLDDEWQQVQQELKLRADRELMMTTCQFCGTPFPSAEATQCAVCGAPRVQGKPD